MSKYASSIELLESRIAPAALVVNSVADAGAGTLRDTITNSHTGNVISFAPALMGKLITLTSGEILINHSLTINGPGAGNLTISGNNNSRIFHVDDGSDSSLLTVTLNSLSLVNAKSSVIGGAIDSAENLIVTNSVLSGNTSSSNGGAIEEFSISAGLLLENTQIVNNSATGVGGGIRFSSGGSFAAIGCLIANNSATGSGGGLSLEEILSGTGDLYMINSTISHNSATTGGGLSFTNFRLGADGAGHTADDGMALLYGSLVTNNTATVAGGGVNFDYGRAMVINSMVKNNAAPQGGGLATTGKTVTLLITGSSFQLNRATDAAKLGGGALYLAPSAAATATTISGTVINTSEFVGNQTAASGGAIHADGTALTLNLTSFRQNAAPSGLGGAILATDNNSNNAVLAITNSEFLANAGGNAGGAVYYAGSSALNLTMVAFRDNSSNDIGGALAAVTSGAISLHSIAATDNASGSGGGALFLETDGAIDLDSLLLTGNSSIGNGGAISLYTSGNATLHHAVISGNTAQFAGGGVSFAAPQFSITASEIIDNIAGTSGGGLSKFGTGKLTLDSATTLVAGNTANDGTQSS